MKWTKLTVENFLSIKQAELSLDNRGLILIEGKNLTSSKFKSNGSGKTSMLDAIVYAIYDMTSKQVQADDVINNKVGKNTMVALEGYKGDDLYRIERYRKHKTNKNKVRLYLNGKEITEKSTKETNKTIQKIVGIDYNTFINSIMFSQGTGAGRFAMCTDKEKKEIFENLVNLEIYAKAQLIAKDKVKEKEREILDKQREGEKLDWELSQIDTLEQQDKANYENTKRLIEQERATLNTLTDRLIQFVNENKTPIILLRNEIDELAQQLENENSHDTSAAAAEEVTNISNQIKDLQGQQNQLNYRKQEKVNAYKKLQLETTCPVCGNELNPEHRAQEMEKIKNELREILMQIQSIQMKVAPLEQQYAVASEEYKKARAEYDNVLNNFRQRSAELREKRQRVEQYEATARSYRDQANAARATIEKLQTIPEPTPRNKEREVIKGKIQTYKEELLALEKEKTTLENVVKVYSNAGVKSHVLDLITPFLNERANKYLAALSGTDMEVKFSTQKENKDGTFSDKFDLQLINRAGGESYKSNSEGEKKRADLAISLAIQDLVLQKGDISSNMIIYDEVFDALDSQGCENIITLLKERLKKVPTILVITHSEHLKNLFDKSVTIVKGKDGTSTLEEGAELT